MADNTESPPPPAMKPFAFLRRPLFVIALLFLGWIFLGQAMMQRHSAPLATPAGRKIQPGAENIKEVAAPDTAIQHRLDDVEARLKALENAAAAPKPADDSANGTNAAKIADLQSKLETLQQAHSTTEGDTAHMMDALHKQEEEITELKAQLATTQTQALHRLALIAAFNTLKDTVMRGESFTAPLKRMTDLAKDDAALQPLLTQLTPYAADSAPTLSVLQDRFEAAVPQALVSDDSNALTRHLQSMIHIRKVGEQQTGGSDEAIIARAEAKLNRGDVKASAIELAALSPHGAKAFAEWNKKAQAFLHIHDALDALQPQLLEEKPASAEPAPNPPATQ